MAQAATLYQFTIDLSDMDRGVYETLDVRVAHCPTSNANLHCGDAPVAMLEDVGVVVGLGVWWRRDGLNGTNVNELTSQALTDLGRAPTFYDCAVQVTSTPAG